VKTQKDALAPIGGMMVDVTSQVVAPWSQLLGSIQPCPNAIHALP